jgi:hypothetical protein
MNGTQILGIIVIAILAIIYAPLITIWALNILFGLTIPINLSTWFATLWITLVISTKTKYDTSNK